MTSRPKNIDPDKTPDVLAIDSACLRDEAPSADAITAYDEAHFAVYLQLLYGAGEGQLLKQLAQEAFGIDADKEPERADKIVTSHLRRAQWMCGDGKRHFSGL